MESKSIKKKKISSMEAGHLKAGFKNRILVVKFRSYVMQVSF